MSTRYSRGRAVNKKPHQRTTNRSRQTDEVTLRALMHGKPRQTADTPRGSGTQDPHEFRDFLRKALASAPADRRTMPESPLSLENLYGEDTSHIRRW